MKCSKCQFENPEGSKFCGECGAKLEKICPECNFANPANFKFCNECGHNLTLSVEKPPIKELTVEEKFGKIQKYLPKGIAEKILSQRDKIEGERKQVTVMFCDMEGFTPFANRFGPEETYAVMDQVYEILIHKVHDFEGTVNEMTGDGIMALLNATIALKNASQQATRSNLMQFCVIGHQKIPIRSLRGGTIPLGGYFMSITRFTLTFRKFRREVKR